MRRRLLLLLGLAGLLVMSLLTLRALGTSSALELDAQEYGRAEQAFLLLASGRSAQAPVGFAVEPVSDPFRGARIEEPERDCRGGGSYVLRQEPGAVPLLISAPHRSADRLTGTLTMRFFVEGRAQAAAWNSVPRRNACGEEGSDIARLRRHPFTAFSTAFARAFPGGRVVQIHGFDKERRRTRAGRTADLILSSGSRTAGPHLKVIAACLRRDLPSLRVALFPDEVRELGATRNAQGIRLRQYGFKGFVHAELSLGLRQHLMRDEALRGHFIACLESGL